MSAYLWEETGKAGTISYKSWKVRVQEVRLLCMGFFAPFFGRTPPAVHVNGYNEGIKEEIWQKEKTRASGF